MPLVLFSLTVVSSRVAQYLVPDEPTFRGQPAAIWIAILGSMVSLLIAFASRRGRRLGGIPRQWMLLLALLLLAWLSTLFMVDYHGDLFSLATILAPTAVLTLALVLPSRAEIQTALVYFGFAVLAGVATTMLAAFTGLQPFREDFEGRIALPILNAFRWEFFFGDANNAASIASFLILIALYRGSRTGWGLGVPAALILVLTQSRTGIVATALGVTVMIAARSSGASKGKWVATYSIVAVAGLVLTLVLLIDPSLNGRTMIWGDFLGIWTEAPVVGLGYTGIQEQVLQITGWAQDGHNVLLDPLVRYGILPFLLGTAFLLTAGVASFGAGLRHKGFPVAMYLTGMACFMTYTTFGWAYMTVFLWPFLLAVMVPGAPPPDANYQFKDSGLTTLPRVG